MSHDSHSTAGHGEHHAHGGTGTYMAVFGGLLILTVISYWLGNSSIKDSAPAAAWAGMMAVSTAKAMLVILFFMHLKWEANWKYVLTIPSMMMSVFLICMLIPDVGMRIKRYSEERMIHAAMAEQAARHGEHAAAEHGAAEHSTGGTEAGGH
ncbi:MAG: cytochrome C oxidase subunit IV family protein [Planctomycetales bacterium]|nr:cytochrome C oxidase subunit IV family protein [Planctomycetales bacterium]